MGLWFGLPRSFADRPTWSGYVGCKSIISWRVYFLAVAVLALGVTRTLSM